MSTYNKSYYLSCCVLFQLNNLKAVATFIFHSAIVFEMFSGYQNLDRRHILKTWLAEPPFFDLFILQKMLALFSFDIWVFIVNINVNET